ncbi:hypothetical protein PTQ33_06025 [Campylobacter sp. 50012-21]|uniref:hypothetical protein n=1 Tax=Campylobacter magnus TaxID=3026462 RepID=UPI00235F2AA8|nr:hypothetical protein [Campylobacter magnus]MDD0846682.1 hypothetical protein [Campylobacter magnus]
MARNSLYHRSNLCVALVAGGVLKAIFDKDSKVAAVVVVATGLYIGIATIIISKRYDEKGNKNV